MKEKLYIECPDCGSGFLQKKDDHKFVCSHCEQEFENCPVCNGKGYYQPGWKADEESDFENCQHCHGTGLINVKKFKK